MLTQKASHFPRTGHKSPFDILQRHLHTHWLTKTHIHANTANRKRLPKTLRNYDSGSTRDIYELTIPKVVPLLVVSLHCFIRLRFF